MSVTFFEMDLEVGAVAAGKCPLTHLDGCKEPSRLKKAKKALKVTKWQLLGCYLCYTSYDMWRCVSSKSLLTHLDGFKEPSRLKKAKRRL
jgi:hypothetical protein